MVACLPRRGGVDDRDRETSCSTEITFLEPGVEAYAFTFG
jgi:hypothetical protein